MENITSILPEKNTVKEENTFNIISDKGNSFTISLKNYSQFIQINSFFQKNGLKTEYEKKFILNDFKSNKLLSICESIDEIYEQLIIEFKKETNKKLIEESNNIHIIIPIDFIKIKEIKLTLDKKKLSDKEIINNLLIDFNNFKNDIFDIKEKYNKLLDENKNLNEKINKLSQDNIQLKKNNEEMNEKITFLIQENQKINNKYLNLEEQLKNENCFENSLIIKNDIFKTHYIIKWIKEKTNKVKINFDLIFTMSKNGSNSDDFHKYCDNKGPTLTLIKTKKNQIFGGFTPLNWNKGNSITIYDPSNQTFIFSLDLFKKFDMIDKEKIAIGHYSLFGPFFGGSDIRMENNMKNGTCFANKSCNYLSNNNIELTGEKGNKISFQTDELEVYKVIYE